MTEIVFSVAVIWLEAILIGFLFSCRIFHGIQKKFLGRALAFICVQFLCVVLVLLGGHLEQRQKLYTNLRKAIDEYGRSYPELVSIEGDPKLVRWAESGEPELPRPDFADSRSVLRWQAALRDSLHRIFGVQDIGSPVAVAHDRISSTLVAPGIKRIFLTFRSFDGTSIPAYLFAPSSEVKKPAIIVLSGHVSEYEQGITQTAGLVESYQHGAALDLAKGGFVTLAIEFRGFGYLGPKVDTEHKLVAHNALLGGSFYKAILTKDIKYALDLLRSLPEVDANLIGVTGVSFGGEMAVTYAALDERVKAVVVQGYGGSVGIEKAVVGKDTKQPHYCHTIPGSNKILFAEDLFYLIAPRPLLGVWGDQDYSGDPSSFSRIVVKGYKALNASSLFEFEIQQGGHEYFVEPSIAFFKRHLRDQIMAP